MIHIVEPSTDIQDDGVQYEDFEESLPCTDFDVPKNPHIVLRLRVLSAHAGKIINNKPQRRFAIEYLTIGRGDYIPTPADVQMAYDYAQQILQDNLADWSGGADAIGEVVKPTKESVERFLQTQ